MYEVKTDTGYVVVLKDGETIAKSDTSGDPERDRAVLQELVERANR